MAWQHGNPALTLSWAPAAALGMLLFGVALGWLRERRIAAQRRVMQRLYKLGEELTASRSSTENLSLLQSVLPELLKTDHVRLYVLDRASKTLHPIEAGVAPGQATAERAGAFSQRAVELCFRNRSLIAIPDTSRDPFFDASSAQSAPRSAMFIPMFAQEDLLGVLEIGDTMRERHFSEDERAVAQHLGNQIAIGMKLLGQKSLREQTSGSERLEAVCRLISAAAAELKQPIITIAGASQAAMTRHPGVPAQQDVSRIASEAQKAAGILSRLLMLTRLHTEQEQPVDLAGLVRDLVSMRENTWAEQGIRVRDLLAREPVVVAAQSSLLEQVFLSLLRHLEDRLAKQDEITLRAFRLAGVAQVNMSWPGPPPGEDSDPLDDEHSPADEVLSLSVCRSFIRGQGGQMRIARDSSGSCRLEVELPLAQTELLGPSSLPRTAARSTMPLTTLVLEPEPAPRQALITALSELGHRSLPATSTGEAVDLVGRLHFHALFCSALIPGEPWLECFEKSRGRVDAFVLLTHGHDSALAAAMPPGEAHVLVQPVRPSELARLVEELEARVAGVAR